MTQKSYFMLTSICSSTYLNPRFYLWSSCLFSSLAPDETGQASIMVQINGPLLSQKVGDKVHSSKLYMGRNFFFLNIIFQGHPCLWLYFFCHPFLAWIHAPSQTIHKPTSGLSSSFSWFCALPSSSQPSSRFDLKNRAWCNHCGWHGW